MKVTQTRTGRHRAPCSSSPAGTLRPGPSGKGRRVRAPPAETAGELGRLALTASRADSPNKGPDRWMTPPARIACHMIASSSLD
jgi:hypothetical protein